MLSNLFSAPKNELITNVGIIAVNVYSLDSLFQNISRQNAVSLIKSFFHDLVQ